MAGKHRADKGKDKPFKHPDVRGETDPAKIKALLEKVKAENEAAMDKIIKDTRS